MIKYPHAKINLGLHILSVRPNGYHEIETCFFPVPLTDILEIVPSDKFHFSMSGFTLTDPLEENICVKAFELLHREYSLPAVKIHLQKNIPFGAGLGGGSSDGAFTLMMLNELFKLKLTKKQLAPYAVKLGSDCPFFLKNSPQVGKSLGEVLKSVRISLQEKFLVLVKPPISIKTEEAYQMIKCSQPKTRLEDILKLPITKWKNSLVNHFEPSIFNEYVNIAHLKNKLYDLGAIYSSMSGSGSVVYGLFNTSCNAKNKFPGCQYWEFKL